MRKTKQREEMDNDIEDNVSDGDLSYKSMERLGGKA